MTEVIFIIVIAAVFALGFYIMKHIDIFLEENYKNILKEDETKEPSCVMLTDELTDEEIIKEVHRFREKHKDTTILLCDNSNKNIRQIKQ